MIEAKALNSWEEFLEKIKETKAKYSRADIFFRGQHDSSMALKTTLERRSKKEWSLKDYARRARSILPQVESFTGRKWNLPDIELFNQKLDSQFDSENDFALLQEIPFYYEYFVYLRHHGFPSPFLDWTRSPYIATFFAFADRSENDNAAIFVLIDKIVRSGTAGEPSISVLRPFVSTHKRHFLQQAEYSIAWRSALRDGSKLMSNNDFKFVHHEDIVAENRKDQFELIKFTIPASERLTILRALRSYNINHFSLMQSEDALVSSLAQECFELDEL